MINYGKPRATGSEKTESVLEAYICFEWITVDRLENDCAVIIDDQGYYNAYPLETTQIREKL